MIWKYSIVTCCWILIWVLVLLLTPIVFNNPGSWFYIYPVKCLLLLFSIALSLKTASFLVKASKKKWVKNGLTSLFSALFLVTLLEGIFTFLPLSSNHEKSLRYINWKRYFWTDNSHGYRDLEWPASSLSKIYFAGDSYLAGSGIKNPEDRVSDIVRDTFSEQFQVLNISRPGADTRATHDLIKTLKIVTESTSANLLYRYSYLANFIRKRVIEIKLNGWMKDGLIDYSDQFVNSLLQNFFERQGVSIVNLYYEIKQIDESKRTISNFNSHPGKVINSLFAELLIPAY